MSNRNINIRRYFVFVFYFCMLLMSPRNLAAQDDQARDTVITGGTITVIGAREALLDSVVNMALKMPMRIQDLPLSAGTIPLHVISSQNAERLGDILPNISGISVQSNFGIHDYFYIRGFESTKAGLVLIDGADEPDNSYFTFYGYGFYDMYNIERVEVLKGPSAFLNGCNTLSGAVHLSRKQPLGETFLKSSISIGQFNSRRGTIDFNKGHPVRNISFRLNGLWDQSDQYREDKRYMKYAINPVLSWKSEQNKLMFNAEYVHTDSKPDAGIPIKIDSAGETFTADVSRRLNYQSDDDVLKLKQYRLRLDYSRMQTENLVIRNKTWLSGLDAIFRISALESAIADYEGRYVAKRRLWDYHDRQVSFGNQFDVSYSFQFAGLTQQMLMGFEISAFAGKLRAKDQPLNSIGLYGREEYPPESSWFYSTNDLWKSDRRIIAPNFLWHGSISSRIDLLLGLRYDIVRNLDSLIVDLSHVGIPKLYRDSFRKNYQNLSPVAGLTYRESENLSFYMNFGRAFGQPVGAVFDPEKSIQYEFGYKYISLNGRFMNSVAVYSLKKYNIRILNAQGLDENSGVQQSTGMEFDVMARLPKDINMILNYTYTDAELDNYNLSAGTNEIKDYSLQRPAFVPMQMMNFWFQKIFYWGLDTNVRIAYVSSRYTNMENSFSVGSYVLLDLMTAYSFKQMSIGITVKNVMNTEWEQQGFGSGSVIPGSPRAIRFTLNINKL